MKKIELHFHTDESSPCGKIKASQGIQMFREKGYDAVVITDHFSKSVLGGPEDHPWTEVKETFLTGYRNAKEASVQMGGIRVFLGMEIRFPCDNNDYLVYGMDEEFFERYPWLYMEDLKKMREVADKEGLALVQAHPFRKGCFPGDVKLLHGIEVYNGNPRHDSHNSQALELAETYHLVQTVGSDFHRAEDLGDVYGELEKMPATGQELAQMILEGKIFIHYEKYFG